MTITLAKIGNSQGIRIPQAILREVKFVDQAEISIKDGKIVIDPVSQNRKNWAEKFKKIADQKEKLLFPDEMSHSWDQEDWQW